MSIALRRGKALWVLPFIFAVACHTDPGVPPGSDLGAADLTAATGDLATAPADLVMSDLAMSDLATSPDFSITDLGGPGDPCLSVCQCSFGNTCVAGKCQPTPALIYCCDRTPCPSGNFCEMADGTGSKCN